VKPLAVCAIFRNEAPFLLEWIAYHSVVGFERFILYDNDSTDGGAELIRSSRFADRATVIRWPQRPGQIKAYQHFIDCFTHDFAWVAFIDLDEFLLPLHGDSIVPLLREWNDFSAVLVRWRCFGPSGWERRPDGLAIEHYTMRLADDAPVNRHVKSLVKCTDLLGVSLNPHEFAVAGKVCDTLGREIPNNAMQTNPGHATLVLNHYITRSKQDWLEKQERGSGMADSQAPGFKPTYDADVFDKMAHDATIKDDAIRRFAPKVRAELDKGLLSLATRLIRFESGLFSLSVAPGPSGYESGLPAVRVSLPPGPNGWPRSAAVNTIRDDGWLTAEDEPALIQVAPGGAEILATLYWAATEPPPVLRLTRLQ